jgi:hypothetical protein
LTIGFTSPFTNLPNIVWLRGERRYLIRDCLEQLAEDPTIKMLIFSNRMTDSSPGKVCMGPIHTYERKFKKTAPFATQYVLGTSDVVATHIDVQAASDVLGEVSGVCLGADGCCRQVPKGVAGERQG